MEKLSIIYFFMALLFSPFLFGIINRTKAFFAGRQGQPVLQLYYDLFKLFHKSAVYSRTTSWIFRLGPLVGLSAVILSTVFISFGGTKSLYSFDGDLILFIYFFGLMRFFTVLAALDTGSSFEGMGASREVQFSVFAEPALFLGLAALVLQTGQTSLSGIYQSIGVQTWQHAGPVLGLVAVVFFIVFLTENCRIPIDDPNTHLELTMIHEVMVLDHGGVDLGFILYSAALKFWLLGSLLVGLVVPIRSGHFWLDGGSFLLGMMGLAVLVGIVESVMARLRLLKIPHLLIGAMAISILGLIFQMR